MKSYIMDKNSKQFIKDIKFDISFTDKIEESSFIHVEYLRLLFNAYSEDFSYVVCKDKCIKAYDSYYETFNEYRQLSEDVYLCIKCNYNNKFLKLTPIIEFDDDEKMDLELYFGSSIDANSFHTIMYNIDNSYVPFKLVIVNR